MPMYISTWINPIGLERGVEIGACYYWEAMQILLGACCHVRLWYNLGAMEGEAGKEQRAYTHT